MIIKQNFKHFYLQIITLILVEVKNLIHNSEPNYIIHKLFSIK